jgi:hypothetical protein
MNPVSLNLPQGAEVFNFLFRSTNPDYLVQDVLSVRLPNGICLDAGWFPEHDPNGQYHVRVYHEQREHDPLFEDATRDIDELTQFVEFLASETFRTAFGVTSSTSDDKCVIA